MAVTQIYYNALPSKKNNIIGYLKEGHLLFFSKNYHSTKKIHLEV